MLGSRAAGPSREPATGSASSCPQAGRPRFVLWARTSVDEHNGASSIPVQLAALRLQLLAAAVPAACVHVHALEGCSVVHETPALGLVDSLAPGSVILATALDRLLRRPTYLEALCTRAAAKGVRVVLAHASLPVARVVARSWTDAENSERHGEADGSESRACGSSTGGGPPSAPPAPSPPLPPPRLQDWVARMAQADQPAAVPCPVLLPTTCVGHSTAPCSLTPPWTSPSWACSAATCPQGPRPREPLPATWLPLVPYVRQRQRAAARGPESGCCIRP
jgi:hypothetical protein